MPRERIHRELQVNLAELYARAQSKKRRAPPPPEDANQWVCIIVDDERGDGITVHAARHEWWPKAEPEVLEHMRYGRRNDGDGSLERPNRAEEPSCGGGGNGGEGDENLSME
jgi:hypothetical protein